MDLKDLILSKVKEEIEKDPENVGYSTCKNDAEIAFKLNTAVIRQELVQYEEIPPIMRILNQIAFAPNSVTEQDISAAKLIK